MHSLAGMLVFVRSRLVSDRSAISLDRPNRYRYRSKVADHRTDTDQNRSIFCSVFPYICNFFLITYVMIYQFQVVFGICLVYFLCIFVIFFLPKLFFLENSVLLSFKNLIGIGSVIWVVIGRSTDHHRSP